ncbi:GAK6 protein, partial [Dicaeum eximium]|nr:GAK6 protein [Dicaeum eximium]
IEMQAAVDIVLKPLAYENANNYCKQALNSIHNHADVELADYVKVCSNISSEQYKGELIATAVAQQLQAAKGTVKCFACSDEGYIWKHCPKGQKTSKKPNKPCPQCKKGLHWSNQCHSKFDKDGKKQGLQKQGNSNRGTQAGAPQPSEAEFSQPPL